MPTKLHPNSTKAFQQERPRLAGRERLILNHLRKTILPSTDRRLAATLGFGENLNAIRPRVTELIAKGLLQQIKSVRCETTGKLVRLVCATRSGE